jgi:hypothetical protein
MNIFRAGSFRTCKWSRLPRTAALPWVSYRIEKARIRRYGGNHIGTSWDTGLKETFGETRTEICPAHHVHRPNQLEPTNFPLGPLFLSFVRNQPQRCGISVSASSSPNPSFSLTPVRVAPRLARLLLLSHHRTSSELERLEPKFCLVVVIKSSYYLIKPHSSRSS